MSWDAATLDRVMCDQSSEMLLVVDPKSLNIISANRQAEVTLGYEATPSPQMYMDSALSISLPPPMRTSSQ